MPIIFDMVFWRALVTGLVGWSGYHIVLMFGCGSVGLTSPLELACYPTDLGIAPGPIAGSFAATTAVALLALTWIPPYRRRLAESAPALALATNLHRLSGYESKLDDPLEEPAQNQHPEPTSPSVEDTPEAQVSKPTQSPESDDIDPSPDHAPELADGPTALVEDLTDDVQALADRITSGSVKPQDVFWQWLALLKEINRQHAQGSVPTETMTHLNGLLLELIPQPRQTRPDPAAHQAALLRQPPHLSPPQTGTA